MENDLRAAIAAKSFEVYFQPQVSLATGAIAGVEALVRWKHTERGMIAPGKFIPVAEKCGLMAAVGKIVIAKAIHEAAEWHRAGLQFGRLAVNVSGTELREDDFDQFLFETLEAFGVFGSSLPNTFYRRQDSLPTEMRYYDGHPEDTLTFGTRTEAVRAAAAPLHPRCPRQVLEARALRRQGRRHRIASVLALSRRPGRKRPN